MSFEPVLMLKYSDVIGEGLSSTAVFFDELGHAGGEPALDIFATINNRLIGGPFEPATHDYLERQYLDERTRRAVARHRFLKSDGIPCVVFTRAGALINLKLLMAGAARGGDHRRAAIGRCVLHANDHAESIDTNRLSSGLLPIVAEFTASWEINNTRDLGPVLRRSYFMYDTLFKHNEPMRELFLRELRTEPADLPFAGLSYDQYFVFIFAIHAIAAAGVKRWTSVVDIDAIAREMRFLPQEVQSFKNGMVQVLGDTNRLFGSLATRSEFANAVNDLSWCFDFRCLRDRPLWRLTDGRFLVPDLQFLIENTSTGLRWHLLRMLPERAQGNFSTFWGKLFERYVQLLIAHYAPAACLASLAYKGGEIDALVQLPQDEVVVVEAKAGYLADNAKLPRNEGELAASIRKRYVRKDDKGDASGVLQLARAVDALYAGAVAGVSKVRRAYPVLVVEDPAMQSLAINAYLDDEYRSHVKTENAMPLTVVTIDELDVIVRTVGARQLDWSEIFHAHFVNNHAAAISVSASLHAVATARSLPVPPDTFLMATGQTLTRMLDAAVARAGSGCPTLV